MKPKSSIRNSATQPDAGAAKTRTLLIQLNGSSAHVAGKTQVEMLSAGGATDSPGKRGRQKERRRVLNILRARLSHAASEYFRALVVHAPVDSPHETNTSLKNALDHVIGLVSGVLQQEIATPKPLVPVVQLLEIETQPFTQPLFQAQTQPQSQPQSGAPSEACPQTPPRGMRTLVHTEVRSPSQLSNVVLNRKPILDLSPDGFIEQNSTEKLRDFHPEVVLYSPQIPPNTGTVARLCAALGARLHLVEPLGFEISSKALRRAGLDYWEFVDVTVHKSLENLLEARPGRRLVFVETGGNQNPEDFDFSPGDLLIFGAETTGVPKDFLQNALLTKNAALVTVPMFCSGVRSINLANTVSIALYSAIAHLHKKFG